MEAVMEGKDHAVTFQRAWGLEGYWQEVSSSGCILTYSKRYDKKTPRQCNGATLEIIGT